MVVKWDVTAGAVGRVVRGVPVGRGHGVPEGAERGSDAGHHRDGGARRVSDCGLEKEGVQAASEWERAMMGRLGMQDTRVEIRARRM